MKKSLLLVTLLAISFSAFAGDLQPTKSYLKAPAQIDWIAEASKKIAADKLAVENAQENLTTAKEALKQDRKDLQELLLQVENAITPTPVKAVVKPVAKVAAKPVVKPVVKVVVEPVAEPMAEVAKQPALLDTSDKTPAQFN